VWEYFIILSLKQTPPNATNNHRLGKEDIVSLTRLPASNLPPVKAAQGGSKILKLSKHEICNSEHRAAQPFAADGKSDEQQEHAAHFR
jgi:hypothetical protein